MRLARGKQRKKTLDLPITRCLQSEKDTSGLLAFRGQVIMPLQMRCIFQGHD
ncbi:hypothetical protein [Exiguobacterium sp. N4-1P]|uniref:hypothetical protein n=1 Tax=Exiguobacterium sp. N4-1P TaxID=2051906 RepID=UPI0012FF7F61|nr:hypothetical protein [Exiguobacterium sp. N4-1P]